MMFVYKTMAAGILGVVHIIFGLVAGGCGLGISGAVGIWPAPFFILTGILCIAGSMHADKYLIIGTLLVNIFSALVGFIMVTIATIAIIAGPFGPVGCAFM